MGNLAWAASTTLSGFAFTFLDWVMDGWVMDLSQTTTTPRAPLYRAVLMRCKITGKRSTGFGNVSDVVKLLSINNLLMSMAVVLENGITIVLGIHFIPLIS